MKSLNKTEPIILVIGDIVFLVASLWVTLLIRHFSIPNMDLWISHIAPFTILFLFWIFTFYVAGLYEKHTLILKNSLFGILLNTQVINAFLAVLFFYFIPYFAITPKTNLFIYLIVSFGFILFWRLIVFKKFLTPKNKQNAVIIGSGEEMKELRHEINNNDRYDFNFIQSIDLENYETDSFKEDVVNLVYEKDVSLIIADIKNPNVETILPQLYNLIFAKVQFVDKYKVYESIFDRVPVSMMSYNWFLENISSKNHISYDILKRLMDILISLPLGIFALVIYPFIALAIKLDDGGDIFFYDERMGKDNQKFKIAKFRSLHIAEGGEGSITRVGKFLRKTRLDEFPQILSVLKGELSLIGPRPERPSLVDVYREQVPFYNVRHLIKPGLSGWAQMKHDAHPHHGADSEATKDKLSFDLYYIKNRSFMLDLKIALQTVTVLLSQKGK